MGLALLRADGRANRRRRGPAQSVGLVREGPEKPVVIGPPRDDVIFMNDLRRRFATGEKRSRSWWAVYEEERGGERTPAANFLGNHTGSHSTEDDPLEASA